MCDDLEWHVQCRWKYDDGHTEWVDVKVAAATPTQATLLATQLVLAAKLPTGHGHVTTAEIIGWVI